MLEAKDLPRCSLSDFIEGQLRETVALDTRLRAQKAGIDESQVSLSLIGHITFVEATRIRIPGSLRVFLQPYRVRPGKVAF